MSTMHVTCFLYLMIVIKHGRLFFKNSSFFKKLQCGILSGPETGRSFRATFWFVFTKPRPTASGPMLPSGERHRTRSDRGERTGRMRGNGLTDSTQERSLTDRARTTRWRWFNNAAHALPLQCIERDA